MEQKNGTKNVPKNVPKKNGTKKRNKKIKFYQYLYKINPFFVLLN